MLLAFLTFLHLTVFFTQLKTDKAKLFPILHFINLASPFALLIRLFYKFTHLGELKIKHVPV